MKRSLGSAVALSLLLVALLACTGDRETPTVFSTAPTPRQPAADSQESPTPTSRPTASATTVASPIPSAGPPPTPTQAPVPDPSPPNSGIGPTEEELWVGDRLSAVVSLYNITPTGIEALRSLDFRWMQAEPGFFGSFGYKKWAGVGEAKPLGVMHELSHSYWGLFPVTGFPTLSFEKPEGKRISPAIERYHRDVFEFMKQPPDHFELLRNRLRNFPNLTSADREALVHSMETDLVSTAGGDLELVPPILRKYWDQFLDPGPFLSWYEAISWYQALPPRSKRLSDKYIGFPHFDLRRYGSLKAPLSTSLRKGIEEIVLQEEQQRLRDFVALFELLIGAPGQDERFKFWRSYLRDKIDLHRRHPGLAASLNLPRSNSIGAALDFLSELEGRQADQKADLVIKELSNRPFLVHFLPALDDLALLKLFASDTRLPDGATLKGTAAFVESLKRFASHIGKILEAGEKDISLGAAELTSFLNGVDFGEKEDLRLFFEILQGSDGQTARGVVAALDDAMLRRLLIPVPTRLRSLLTPHRFMEFLDITLDSSPEELALGIQDMIVAPSGNFRVNEPFLEEMYRVVASKAAEAPLDTLEAVAGSPFPMERFMSLYPRVAVDLLANDINVTVEMVVSSDELTFSPARFVYRLIYADPGFAAQVVGRLDTLGEESLVLESLAHFAYDADRLQAVPGLLISLEKDGRFLQKLLEDQGAQWLEAHIGDVVRLYEQRIQREESPGDFLMAYERTLRTAVSELDDAAAARDLEAIITRSFQG